MSDASDILAGGQYGQTAANMGAQQQLLAAQAGYYGAETQHLGVENQAAQYAQQMARYNFGRQQAFMRALPTTDYQTLVKMFPDQIATIKSAHDTQDDFQKTTNRTTIGSALAAAHSGDIPTAVSILQTRHDEDTKTGHGDEVTQHIIDGLNSQNPNEVTAAKTMMANLFATSLDPKEAPAILKSLGVSQEPLVTKGGDTATNPLTGGRSVVPLPVTPQTLNEPNGGQKLITVDPNAPGYGSTPGGVFGSGGQTGGGGQASTGGPPAAAGAPGAAPDVQSAQASGLTGIIKSIESGNIGDYNPDGTPLVNKKSGARYAMQVMPDTAKKPGYGVRPAASDTPAEYNRVGEQLLQKHIDFYGDPLKGAAAYQAGRGNVHKAIVAATKEGDPNNWVAHLGPAGRDYVAKFGTRMAQLGSGGTQVATNAPLSPADLPQPPQGTQVASTSPTGDYMGPSGGQAVIADTGAGIHVPITKGAEAGYQIDPTTGGEVPMKGGSEDPSAYPPAVMQGFARDMLLGKPLPFQGSSGAAVKRVAMQQGQQLMNQLHITPEQLNLIRAKNTAYTNAYQPTMLQLSALQSSEDALKANAQQLRDKSALLVKLGVTGGSPLINKHMLDLAEQGGTQAQKNAVQQYLVAVNGLSGEYAKFMSSSSGQSNGAPTDSMKHQADEVVNGHLNNGTMNAGIDQILTEATNKRASVDHQRAFLEKHIADPFGEHDQPLPPHGARQVGTYHGKPVMQLPDGRRVVQQ